MSAIQNSPEGRPGESVQPDIRREFPDSVGLEPKTPGEIIQLEEYRPRGRGRWFDRHKQLVEAGMVLVFTGMVIAGAIKMVGDENAAKAKGLANLRATPTAMVLSGRENPTVFAYAQATSTPFPVPTETATPTAIPAKTPTIKPTERPANTATATATATKESLDPNPKLIAEGQLPKYTELSSIEALAKEAKGETGYKKLVLSLAFSDLEEVSFEKVAVGQGSWWRVKTKGTTKFVSFVEAPVISYARYAKFDAEDRKKPWIVVPTPDELAEMRQTSPKVGSIVKILVPGEGNIMHRELIISPGPDTTTKSQLKPGDKVQPGDILETLDGEFGLTVNGQNADGKVIPATADFNLFVRIGNKVGLPFNGSKTGK